MCDTQINPDPTAEQLVDIALLAAEEIRRFGLTPRAALLRTPVSEARTRHRPEDAPGGRVPAAKAPDMEVEGELQGDAALSRQVLERILPDSRLTDGANLLVMPNLDAANITFSCLRVVASQGVTVGPILLGCGKPAHIPEPVTTVRGIVNMTALTAVKSSVHAA